MKHKLNNGVSTLYQYVFSIIGIGYFGFLIYTIITQDIIGIIICSIFVLFAYLFFILKIKKIKEIEFDEHYVYFDETKISYKDIVDIKFGKIVFKVNDGEKVILFGFIPFSNRFNLLKDFYNNKTQ